MALVIQAALSRAWSRLQFREERLRGRLLFSVLSLFKPGSAAPLRNALQVVACLDVLLLLGRRSPGTPFETWSTGEPHTALALCHKIWENATFLSNDSRDLP